MNTLSTKREWQNRLTVELPSFKVPIQCLEKLSLTKLGHAVFNNMTPCLVAIPLEEANSIIFIMMMMASAVAVPSHNQWAKNQNGKIVGATNICFTISNTSNGQYAALFI